MFAEERGKRRKFIPHIFARRMRGEASSSSMRKMHERANVQMSREDFIGNTKSRILNLAVHPLTRYRMKGGKIYVFCSERGVKISIFRRRRMVIIIIANSLHYIRIHPSTNFISLLILNSRSLTYNHMHKHTHSTNSSTTRKLKFARFFVHCIRELPFYALEVNSVALFLFWR
jgi:hypothetical protein